MKRKMQAMKTAMMWGCALFLSCAAPTASRAQTLPGADTERCSVVCGGCALFDSRMTTQCAQPTPEQEAQTACYTQHSKCVELPTGKCGWEPSADLDACLKEKGGKPPVKDEETPPTEEDETPPADDNSSSGKGNAFYYQADADKLSNGCELKLEDNNVDLQMLYMPDTKQFYIQYTTMAVNPETGEAASDGKGAHQENFWLVVTPGPIPNGSPEYGILYVDVPLNRIVAYAYVEGGPGGAESYRWPGSKYIGSVDGAIKVETKGLLRTVSFLLDVETLNSTLPVGIAFNEKIGVWLHNAFGAKLEYSDGKSASSTSTTTTTTTTKPTDTKPTTTTPGTSTTKAGASAKLTETVKIVNYDFTNAKEGPFYDTGEPEDTQPVTIVTKTSDKADPSDVSKVIKPAPTGPLGVTPEPETTTTTENEDGGEDDPNQEEGNEGTDPAITPLTPDNKRFSWCTLHDDLISHGELGVENVGSVSVRGPKHGFIDVDTLQVPCLSSFKLYIDASPNVEAISIALADGVEVPMRVEENADKRFFKENGEKRFVVANIEGDGAQLFGYGVNEFTLTITTVDGKEVKEEHQLIIPVMEMGK